MVVARRNNKGPNKAEKRSTTKQKLKELNNQSFVWQSDTHIHTARWTVNEKFYELNNKRDNKTTIDYKKETQWTRNGQKE